MEKIGRRILKKQKKKLERDKRAFNFNTASTATILFDALIPDAFTEIKEFKKYLKQQGISCTVYGYVDQKEVPHEMLLWSNFEFITRKDLSWLGKPRGKISDEYFAGRPDILFVFRFGDSLAMDYLTELSMARFKVGCYNEDPNDLDLMINPPDRNCEIHYFVEQVKHYLTMLNPS